MQILRVPNDPFSARSDSVLDMLHAAASMASWDSTPTSGPISDVSVLQRRLDQKLVEACYISAVKKSLDVVEVLLSLGADVNAREARPPHRPVLVLAAAAGNPALVRLLLGHGNGNAHGGGMPLDVDAAAGDGSGLTALGAAAQRNDVAIARLLLETGRANPNLPLIIPELGGPVFPLHLAAQHASLPLLRLLLQSRADPSVRDGQGDSPLFTAIRYGRLEAVVTLLTESEGPAALLQQRNRAGQTPREFADTFHEGPERFRIRVVLREVELGVDRRRREGNDEAANGIGSQMISSASGVAPLAAAPAASLTAPTPASVPAAVHPPTTPPAAPTPPTQTPSSAAPGPGAPGVCLHAQLQGAGPPDLGTSTGPPWAARGTAKGRKLKSVRVAAFVAVSGILSWSLVRVARHLEEQHARATRAQAERERRRRQLANNGDGTMGA